MNRFILIFFIVIMSDGIQAQENRTFMFIGEPNAAAWKVMMDDPGDRKAAVSSAFEKIGGKIISYYFGLGDGKNYIICELPNDNELIQAVYVMRLPTGLLASYHIIELMPSDQMSKALVKSKELLEIEKQTGGGVPKGN